MSTLPASDEVENVETHQNTAALGQLDATKGPDREDDGILDDKSENGDDLKDLETNDNSQLDDDDDKLEDGKKEVEDDNEDQIEDDLALGGVIDTEAFALITGIFVEVRLACSVILVSRVFFNLFFMLNQGHRGTASFVYSYHTSSRHLGSFP